MPFDQHGTRGGLGAGLSSLRVRIVPIERAVLSSAEVISCDDDAPTDKSVAEPTRSRTRAWPRMSEWCACEGASQ